MKSLIKSTVESAALPPKLISNEIRVKDAEGFLREKGL